MGLESLRPNSGSWLGSVASGTVLRPSEPREVKGMED